MRGFNLWMREKERFAKRERELHVRSEGMPLPMLAVACNGELEGMIFLEDQDYSHGGWGSVRHKEKISSRKGELVR